MAQMNFLAEDHSILQASELIIHELQRRLTCAQAFLHALQASLAVASVPLLDIGQKALGVETLHVALRLCLQYNMDLISKIDD